MDDDGASAYILYNSYDAGGQNTIDKLTPDFTASTITQNSGWLPMPGGDSGEAQAMVRRNGVYFAVFGHYCCFCAQGSGAVVHTATSPLGPYTLTGQWDRSMPAPPHCPAMPRHDNTSNTIATVVGASSACRPSSRSQLVFAFCPTMV